MLGKVIIENGQKKIQALTADTGVGAPVGSYLYLEKKSNPQGYLYCDGSTFDETAYPALYQYLGTNVLPDWRELGAKGAEKNTTLIFDSTETDPSTGQAGTQNHDVFAQGEFKDDQLQEHNHDVVRASQDFPASISAWVLAETATSQHGNKAGVVDVTNARHGDVTRGKSRAVFIYIKATSGLTENQQENVLNTINENNSYSTEEHPTGAKWIDGKPIYRKVVDFGTLPNTNSKRVNHSISNMDTVLKYNIIADDGTYYVGVPRTGINATDKTDVFFTRTYVEITTWSDLTQYVKTYVIIEYTKTTD